MLVAGELVASSMNNNEGVTMGFLAVLAGERKRGRRKEEADEGRRKGKEV